MKKSVFINTFHQQGSLADDILLTFLMTFAFAAYSYEARLDSGVLSAFRYVLLAVLLLTLLITAAKNGINKKTGFIVYSAAYWLLPQLVIVLFYQGPEIFRHSVTMYTLSEFAAILTTRPAEILGGYCGIPHQMILVIMLLCIFGAFFVGAYFSDKDKTRSEKVN